MANEVLLGLQQLAGSLQQFAQGEALRDASQEVKRIKTEITDEKQRMTALQDVANNFVGRFIGSGGDAASANTFLSGLEPPRQQPFVNAVDVLARGSEEQKQEIRDFETFKSNLKTKNQKKSTKTLPTRELDKIQVIGDTATTIDSLLQKVEQNPSFVGRGQKIPGSIATRAFFDEDFDSFNAEVGRFFDQYRVATTGAGASVKELELIKKNTPSVSDKREAFQLKLKNLKDIGEKIIKRRLNTLNKAGFDVEGLLNSQQNTTPPDSIFNEPGFSK